MPLSNVNFMRAAGYQPEAWELNGRPVPAPKYFRLIKKASIFRQKWAKAAILRLYGVKAKSGALGLFQII